MAQTIEKFTLKNADLLQPAYDYAAQYCLNKGGQKSDKVLSTIEYIKMNFFQTWTLSTKARPYARLENYRSRQFRFRKGQQTLVRAMDKIDGNCTLTLVGQGKDEMNILSIIRKLNLESRVKLINSVNNSGNERNLY